MVYDEATAPYYSRAGCFRVGKELPSLPKRVACCSSPAAICYWFVASLMALGVLSLIGIFWPPLDATSPSACLFAMAIGCFANWIKNRSYHCAITGPSFLVAGVVFLLSGERILHVNDNWVWTFVVIGTGIAFLLEWRYAKRAA